jgi:Cu2+-exporting ATPase
MIPASIAVTAESTCIHCGQTLAEGQENFCCTGCEAAYTLQRNLIEAGPQEWSEFVRAREDGTWELQLAVEGIHCASCIWNIESSLREEAALLEARVNYTTQRLRLVWRGEKQDGDRYAARVTSLGYRLHPLASSASEDSDQHQNHLLRCLAVSGFASGNLMLISVALWSSTAESMGMATRDMLHWLSALISIPALAFAARPFLGSAWKVLKQGRTNMDVPISLAIVLATGMSLWETSQHGKYVYFDSAVMFTFFLLIGRYLDARARGKAKSAAAQLLSMLQGSATVLENGMRRVIPLDALERGMRVLVAAGEKIPADGYIVKGISTLDTSLITGETMPQSAVVGTRVFSGTINIDGPLEIDVVHGNDQTLLSQIVRLMENAAQGQAHYVRLADRAAQLYTPSVHALAALTFFGWFFVMGAPWQVALMIASTVLIITCPCALGLAVPVVQVLASGRLMKRGILLKSGDALERLATIDTIIFDKTGTLTEGKPRLTSALHDEAALRLAASLAVHSKHPLSRALLAAYQGPLIPLEVSEHPGKGLEAKYLGQTVRLGNRAFCGVEEQETGAALEIWLTHGHHAPLHFTFADQLREDAVATIVRLKEQGLAIYLLSGDRPFVVKEMAMMLGITQYESGLTPIDKCEFIQQLTAQGRRVLMVGDGLNDTPALTAATVSMSPSSAIDIAQNAADVVFQGHRLKPVLITLDVARRSTKLVRENLAMALLYNVIAVPIAVLGYVTPLIAAIAMSSSSLVVIANAFRLTRSKGDNA